MQSSASRPARGLPPALFIVGASVFFALLFAAMNYSRDVAFGSTPSPSLWRTVYLASARWLLYAALAPAVAWLAGRLPLERQRLARTIAVHLVAAAAFAALHTALLVVALRAVRFYPLTDSMLEAYRRLTFSFFAMNYATYFGIAGACHAWNYYQAVRERDLLAADLRASLTQARLDALRGQLNPHFLFNTLNATSALALTGQKEQVVETLSALSDLLRVSLDRDLPQEVPLERELSILAAYLDIQRIRFGDRLAIALDVDAACATALVPSMVLQPLLENAFEHGVARWPGPGKVTVRARRDPARLCLRVEDTGPGFASGHANNGNGRGQGIGLSNTEARLEQLYGRAATIERGNLADGGAFVELLLPLRDAKGTP